jgi:hypothetical protein
MRRLILELTEEELSRIGINIPMFQHIKSLELLHFLRQDWEEFAAVWRVVFKDTAFKAKDLLSTGLLAEVQVLEQEKSGAYTVFIRGGPILSSVLNSMGVVDGYLFPPLAIRDGKIKLSFLGNSKQVSTFLEKMDARGVNYRVVMLTEASFGPDSPLTQLTDKQREVLITAYKLGYYDIPRRINSDQLDARLKIGNSTLVEHLRKAERRLLVQVLTRGNDFWINDSLPEK